MDKGKIMCEYSKIGQDVVKKKSEMYFKMYVYKKMSGPIWRVTESTMDRNHKPLRINLLKVSLTSDKKMFVHSGANSLDM